MNLNLNVNLKPVLRYGVFTAAIYLIFVVAMLPAQNAWGFLQPLPATPRRAAARHRGPMDFRKKRVRSW